MLASREAGLKAALLEGRVGEEGAEGGASTGAGAGESRGGERQEGGEAAGSSDGSGRGRSMAEAKALIEKSFGNYLANEVKSIALNIILEVE